MTRKNKRTPQPPIPDLRFEHSYRRAIEPANGSIGWIIAITLRDQLFLPFLQGFIWESILMGFRSWKFGVSKNGSVWGSEWR